MEDVLSVYQRELCIPPRQSEEFKDSEVLVCMDETTKQHTKETRVPVGLAPGRDAVYDYEYERNGVSNLFMLSAPLGDNGAEDEGGLGGGDT